MCLGRSSSWARTLVYRDTSGKYAGITAESKGRKAGRQAQRMPTLVSTAESMAAGGLSKVGSVEFEIATSE